MYTCLIGMGFPDVYSLTVGMEFFFSEFAIEIGAVPFSVQKVPIILVIVYMFEGFQKSLSHQTSIPPREY